MNQYRRDFPMLKKNMNGKSLIYFDSAATTQKPHAVIDTLTQFYTHEYATVHRAVYEIAAKATERYSAVRRKIQKFINSEREEEIIFTRGTTDAINMVARILGENTFEEGDEIIISTMEHHSNIVPWQLLASRKGLRLKWIPITDKGELDLDVFEHLLSNRTKLISVAHVANSTGTVNPIETIIEMGKKRGALIFIDGAQAAGHMPLNVKELGADFYAFSGHKIYGPTGVGVLFGRYELLDKLPPYQGGGDMIDRVSVEGTSFQPPPLKFEAGTPMIAQVVGLGAAIDYLEAIGMEKIHDYEQALLRTFTQKLKEVKGIDIIGEAPKKGAIVSFTIDGLHALDIGTIMSLKGIAMRTGHLCAQPLLKHFELSSLARISFGIYNNFEEIETFIQVLEEARLLLQPQLSF